MLHYMHMSNKKILSTIRCLSVCENMFAKTLTRTTQAAAAAAVTKIEIMEAKIFIKLCSCIYALRKKCASHSEQKHQILYFLTV